MSEKNQNPFMDDNGFELKSTGSRWSPEVLLEQSGIFYLEEVVKTLDIDSKNLEQLIEDMLAADKDIWRLMGIRKIWGHWIVRMAVFAPFYHGVLAQKIRKIPDHWDAGILLKQSGWFFLRDVCGVLSLSVYKLHSHLRKQTHPRETVGVWKDPRLNAFIVDMSLFGPWVSSLDQSDRADTPKSTKPGKRTRPKPKDDASS